tara:strand:+ start:236 stop:358 length:123 start_codon:yes stop_codon:yes gene_type:complete
MKNISILIIFLCILGCGKKGSLEFPPTESKSNYKIEIYKA